MTATITHPISGPPPKRLWTRAELKFLVDAGAFGPDERLELIEGEIVEKMPQNTPHATGISATEDKLRRILPGQHYIRVQMPLAVSEYNQPVPDIAVVAGSFRDYEADHPSTAALVVEVADTSLAFDRMTKAGLYARASVPEYWIINLSDRLLEVHREPAALSGEPGGYHYKSIERYDDSATIGPLIAPNAADRIADLLPTSA